MTSRISLDSRDGTSRLKLGCEIIVGATACISPWAFGSVDAWAEFGLGICVAILAVFSAINVWKTGASPRLLNAGFGDRRPCAHGLVSNGAAPPGRLQMDRPGGVCTTQRPYPDRDATGGTRRRPSADRPARPDLESRSGCNAASRGPAHHSIRSFPVYRESRWGLLHASAVRAGGDSQCLR